MRFTLLLLIFGTYYSSLNAQHYNQEERFLKANSVWVFGQGAGLDFNGDRPDTVHTSIVSVEGSASVSDSTGQLLFYLGSHGTVWNRNHVPMLNGTALYPYHLYLDGSSSAQGVVIVPVIDTPWKYYIFTNTQKEAYGLGHSPPTLTYSVIDMTLDNGLGAIESGRKNIPLYNYGLGEGMIAIPGENCDIWLLTLSSMYGIPPADPNIPNPLDTQCFLAWHITRDGISSDPVVSHPHSALSENGYYTVMMSVSPNRQRIAMGLHHIYGDRNKKGVLISKFDPASGKLYDGIVLSTSRHATNYGSSFSPDNTKLYTVNGNMGILQFDIETHDSATILSSTYRVAGAGVHALKLYNDTIYYARPSKREILYRINRPNKTGYACEVDTIHINFEPTINGFSRGPVHSLSNEVVFPISKVDASISYDTLCKTPKSDQVGRILTAKEGYELYEWDDGSINYSREVSAAGIYWVKYRNRYDCMTYVDTFAIHVIDLDFSLGEDKKLLFCDHPDSYLPLKANTREQDVTYRWQDGSTGNQFQVAEPGSYWVEARKGSCVASDTIYIDGTEALNLSDTVICKGDRINITLQTPHVPEGTIIQWNTGSSEPELRVSDSGLYAVTLINPPCVLSDSARISMEYCDCYAQMPNAFSPNGDGLNDLFTPMVDPNCPIQGYRLTIYNRYGERIFHTSDVFKGWDGFHKGHPVDAGVYFYEVHFYGGTRLKEFHFKGDVTVIR